jgi:hypothetical protein
MRGHKGQDEAPLDEVGLHEKYRINIRNVGFIGVPGQRSPRRNDFFSEHGKRELSSPHIFQRWHGGIILKVFDVKARERVKRSDAANAGAGIATDLACNPWKTPCQALETRFQTLDDIGYRCAVWEFID